MYVPHTCTCMAQPPIRSPELHSYFFCFSNFFIFFANMFLSAYQADTVHFLIFSLSLFLQPPIRSQKIQSTLPSSDVLVSSSDVTGPYLFSPECCLFKFIFQTHHLSLKIHPPTFSYTKDHCQLLSKLPDEPSQRVSLSSSLYL